MTRDLLATRMRLRPRFRTALVCAAAAVLAVTTGGGCVSSPKPTGRSTSESTADKHYQVAVGSFHNGMLEDAKLQLERALQSDLAHADSHYLRGVILLHEGKAIMEALESERCLVDAAAELQRQRADELHGAARDSFAKAVEHYEPDAAGRGRAYNSMAVVSLYFHDYVQAVTQAREALRAQFYTERFSALSNLGWAYYGSGDLIRATTELRQAVLLNPDYCVGHYRLSQVYLDQGLADSAEEEAMRVVESERCPIQDAHRILGVARLRLGHDEEARAAFDGCVQLAPRSCLAGDCRSLSPEEGLAAREPSQG